MSTCPKDDIHVLYLDEELPSKYKAEYEAHIKGCSRCAEKLKRLEAVHRNFAEDSKNITLNAKELENSFDRLSARLSYSKVVKTPALQFKPLQAVRYAAVGVAAALAVAIIIPRGGAKSSSALAQSSFEPVARSAMTLPASGTVYMDGELSPASLSNLLEADVSSSDSFATQSVATLASYNPLPLVQRAQNPVNPTSTLASYDVFTPVEAPYTEPAEEKNAFSVEFSLRNFHFKAKGSR